MTRTTVNTCNGMMELNGADQIPSKREEKTFAIKSISSMALAKTKRTLDKKSIERGGSTTTSRWQRKPSNMSQPHMHQQIWKRWWKVVTKREGECINQITWPSSPAHKRKEKNHSNLKKQLLKAPAAITKVKQYTIYISFRWGKGKRKLSLQREKLKRVKCKLSCFFTSIRTR